MLIIPSQNHEPPSLPDHLVSVVRAQTQLPLGVRFPSQRAVQRSAQEVKKSPPLPARHVASREEK